MNPKDRRPKKSRRVLLFLAAVFLFSLLVAGAAALFDDRAGKTKGGDGWFSRTRDAVSTFLGGKPRFYHLVVERNGADEKLKEENVFVLTYRDEFVIKEVATSSPFGSGITVDVEGAGGDSDLRVLLKGVELVDRVVREKAAPSKKDSVYAYGIAVRFKGEEIARIPVQVEVSPQDWLRFAKDSDSQRSQIRYLEQAVAASKDDVNLRKTLAAAHVKAGNIDRAIREYRTVLAAKPGDEVALRELSRCYLAKKDYLEAQETAKRLVKVNPKDGGAYATIALAYGKQKKWDRAIANYQESLKWNPDDVNVLMNLGEAYEMTGKTQSAIEQYRKALAKNPQDKTVKAALADAYKRAGDHQAAIKLYSDVIQEKPKDAGARSTAPGKEQGTRRNWKEEVEEYQKVLKTKPDDPVTRYNLAMAYEKGKMYREAASEYEKVLTAKPDNAEALSRLSNIYFQEKRYRDAILFLNKLKKSAPKNAAVYAHTGFAYGELKQYKEASWNYAKAIELGSKDPQVRYNLATVYRKMGREKDAIREYEKFAAVNPNTEVLTILGDYYVKTRNYDGAIKTYKKLAGMEGGKAAGYSGLGRVSDLKGQTDQAIENYKTALRHGKKDEQIYLQLAKAYEKKGKSREALEAYTSAYNINPDSGDAADGITRMKISEIQKKHKE